MRPNLTKLCGREFTCCGRNRFGSGFGSITCHMAESHPGGSNWKSTCAVEIFFRPPLIHYYGQRSVILSNQVWNNKATEINQAFKNYFVLKIVNLLLNVGNTDPFYTGFRHCKLFSFFFISLGRRRQSLHMLHETLEEPTIYTFLRLKLEDEYRGKWNNQRFPPSQIHMMRIPSTAEVERAGEKVNKKSCQGAAGKANITPSIIPQNWTCRRKNLIQIKYWICGSGTTWKRRQIVMNHNLITKQENDAKILLVTISFLPCQNFQKKERSWR